MQAGTAAYEVLRQVRPLYQSSGRAVAEALEGTRLTVPLRAVLEFLIDQAPMTVPQVAREFGVTRQSVQVLVDTAAADGLVELRDNPHHRRSRLVVVTEQGSRAFAEVHRQELADLARVTADMDTDELARCARVLTVLTQRIRDLHHHGHRTDDDLNEEPA